MNLNKILAGSAVEAAPLLLGCVIGRKTLEGPVILMIVETEAYHQNDPASHSFRGQTLRTSPMFESGGRLYIYFTYGMHYCMNIVTGKKGVGEAVLIRAGEPLEGLDIMAKNRSGVTDIHKLANGPAKLTQALGITNTSLSDKLLNKSSIFLQQPKKKIEPNDIVASPRIGIREARHQPWRFYIKDNSFVSKRPK